MKKSPTYLSMVPLCVAKNPSLRSKESLYVRGKSPKIVSIQEKQFFSRTRGRRRGGLMSRDMRRVEPGTHRTYEVKEIWDTHQEIIRLIVLGYGNVEIADMVGYTPQTVSNIRNSPVVRERIEELQSAVAHRTVDIAARVRAFEPVALEHLEQIILGRVQGVSEALRAKTCENYLSRGGHGTVQKIAAVSGTLTREDIEALKQRAKDAARAQGAMEVEWSNVE